MAKRGGDEKIDHALLKESILKHVQYLISKAYLQEKEVYDLVKEFFKQYLGLDYEFTHEELLIELQNVFLDKKLEDSVLGFLRKTSKIEYSDEKIDYEDMKKLLEEFKKIVDTLIKVRKKEKNFLLKLLFWKGQKDEIVPVERQEQDEIVDVIEDLEEKEKKKTKPDLFSHKERTIKTTPVTQETEKKVIKEEKKAVKDAEKKLDTAEKQVVNEEKKVISVIEQLKKEMSSSEITPKLDIPNTKQTPKVVPKVVPKVTSKQKLAVNKGLNKEQTKPVPEVRVQTIPAQTKPKEESKDETIMILFSNFASCKPEEKRVIYDKAKKEYDKLTEDHQRKHYAQLNNLYEEIANQTRSS